MPKSCQHTSWLNFSAFLLSSQIGITLIVCKYQKPTDLKCLEQNGHLFLTVNKLTVDSCLCTVLWEIFILKIVCNFCVEDGLLL